MERKTCTKCKLNKASADFFRFKFSSDGLQSYCKVRQVADVAWYHLAKCKCSMVPSCKVQNEYQDVNRRRPPGA